MIIPQDMIDLHISSMERHRDRVKKALNDFAASGFAKELNFSETDAKIIGNKHDADKISGPLVEPYSIISAVYDGRLDEEEYPYTPELDHATRYHVKHNKHHPESWDDNWNPTKVKSWDQRRSTDGHHPADASKMDERAMIEMCADWTAQSLSFGNSTKSWSDRVRRDGRYLFTDEQWDFIIKCLKLMNNY